MVDSIDVPVISEKVDIACVHVKNSSTGKTPSGWVTIQSRYLRGSTGSCHDRCKHGRQDAFEAKKNCRFSNRVTGTQICHDLLTVVTSAEGRRNSLISPKLSCSQSITPTYHPEIKAEVPSPSKKTAVSLQPTQPRGQEAYVLSEIISSPNLKTAQTKHCISPAPAGDSSSKRTSKVNSRKQLELLQKNPSRSFNSRRMNRAEMTKEIEALQGGEMNCLVASSPKVSVQRVASISGRNNINYRSLRRAASDLKNQHNVWKPEIKKPNSVEVPEKTLYIIEPTAKYKTMEVTQDFVHATLSSPSSGNKKLRGAQHGSLNIQSRLSSDSKSSKQSKKSLGRHLSLSSAVLPSLHDEAGIVEQKANSEAKNKIIPKRGGLVSLEDADCSSEKPSFRKGTVLAVENENDSPRRLTFRQGRLLLTENQNQKGDQKMSFRRREGDDGGPEATKAESEKVVLRHQDVQGKDPRSLFNNVIEETASKLVEARKSKVKALVGAFETVISLQDIKGLSTTT